MKAPELPHHLEDYSALRSPLPLLIGVCIVVHSVMPCKESLARSVCSKSIQGLKVASFDGSLTLMEELAFTASEHVLSHERRRHGGRQSHTMVMRVAA